MWTLQKVTGSNGPQKPNNILTKLGKKNKKGICTCIHPWDNFKYMYHDLNSTHIYYQACLLTCHMLLSKAASRSLVASCSIYNGHDSSDNYCSAFQYLSADRGSLQVLYDDEVCGRCLQSTVRDTKLRES